MRRFSVQFGRCGASYATLPYLIKPHGAPATLPKLDDFSVADGVKGLFSSRQLELHYTKHHKAYVDKLNSLVGLKYEGWTIEDIAKDANKTPSAKVLFNQAAQHFNHSFFWKCLTGSGPYPVPSSLLEQIAKDFVSLEQFKVAFQNSAVANFGSIRMQPCPEPSTESPV